MKARRPNNGNIWLTEARKRQGEDNNGEEAKQLRERAARWPGHNASRRGDASHSELQSGLHCGERRDWCGGHDGCLCVGLYRCAALVRRCKRAIRRWAHFFRSVRCAVALPVSCVRRCDRVRLPPPLRRCAPPLCLSPSHCAVLHALLCSLLCHVGAASVRLSHTPAHTPPLRPITAHPTMSPSQRLPGGGLLSLCGAALLLLVAACALPSSVSAAHSFDAYRLVQYDRGTRALGSRRTAFNYPAVVQSAAEADAITAAESDADVGGWNSAADDEDDESVEVSSPKSAAADLQRKVVVLPIAQATPSKLRSLLRVRLASALLLVLPADLTSLPAETLAHYASLERFLASRAWEGCAVYFAFEDEYLAEMVENLRATLGDSTATGKIGDKYHLQVSTADATVVTGGTVTNLHVREHQCTPPATAMRGLRKPTQMPDSRHRCLARAKLPSPHCTHGRSSTSVACARLFLLQGWQHAAASSTADSDTLPTIAVVASYDALAAAPGLARSVNTGASGAVALLEVARIFNRLYSDFRTQGSYNLLFVLTGLDRVNYLSTKNWLRNIDSRILESMEFALCLDRLAASSAPLYLHVSKLPKSPEIASWYSHFELTAKHMGVALEVVHRKINISDPTVYWQHEQFSRKRIVAATLSSSRTPQANLWEGGMFDTLSSGSLSVDNLARNIKLVVESLGRQIYGLSKAGVEKEGSAPVEILAGMADIHPASLRAQLGLMGSASRFAAVLSPADSKAAAAEHTVSGYLESSFARHTTDHKKHTVLVDQLLGAGPTGAGAGNPGWKFWADKPGGVVGSTPRVGVVEMQAFQVKPFMFEIYVSLAIAVWMLVVYIACKQPSSVADVVEILIGKQN